MRLGSGVKYLGEIIPLTVQYSLITVSQASGDSQKGAWWIFPNIKVLPVVGRGACDQKPVSKTACHPLDGGSDRDSSSKAGL